MQEPAFDEKMLISGTKHFHQYPTHQSSQEVGYNHLDQQKWNYQYRRQRQTKYKQQMNLPVTITVNNVVAC